MLVQAIVRGISSVARPRLVAVVLSATVLVPAAGYASPDCGIHGISGDSHAAGAMVHGATESGWQAVDSPGECPHCLPDLCAIAPACSGSLTGVSAGTGQQIPTIPCTAGPIAQQNTEPRGLELQPPTPPPQHSV